MKKTTILLAVVLLITTLTTMAQVAINTDDSDADASAMLDVESTSQGFLMPRMTTAQRDAIVAPTSGLMIYNTTTRQVNSYSSAYWIELSLDDPPVVTNATTGETWMDRNLGASQVATSSADSDAYGYLYQWGRASDGHQIRTSSTTSTNATTAVPNDGNIWDGLFITESSNPKDWLTPQNDNLWQGITGTNNPCPSGFRLPADTELNAERASWPSYNAASAYASVLKLTVGGYRDKDHGNMGGVGISGRYWSSTVSSTTARYLLFYNTSAHMATDIRAIGYSIRCIKD